MARSGSFTQQMVASDSFIHCNEKRKGIHVDVHPPSVSLSLNFSPSHHTNHGDFLPTIFLSLLRNAVQLLLDKVPVGNPLGQLGIRLGMGGKLCLDLDLQKHNRKTRSP